MKAARYLGDHAVRVDDIPVPGYGARDVLIRPLAVGLCATDTHIVDGAFVSRPPMTLGHEIAGEIVAVGSEVINTAIGDLVTVEPHLYCGVCIWCQNGNLNMCPERQAPGVHLDGGMAEFLAVPETLAYALPANTPPQFGAMTEPIACAIHAMDRLSPKSGLPIAIFGSGPAGAVLIALAKLAGLGPIVAVDTREQRRDLALRFGADVAVDPAATDFAERMNELSAGNGFPYIIDAVGSSRVLTTAIEIAARGANILLFGVANPDDTATVRPHDIYARELSLIGTALNPFTHRRAANLLASLPLHELNAGFFGLDDVEAALQAQRDGTYDKVFITPQEVTQR
ncbi:MAG TPA: alcohol dehydrogenase catalytic domain-containing protein [Candidatus Agrococcus pullicola]|uniref:Alcohol dehydrogenase catalytic domain-containing protein n=1 Tax=Candidatus Agrococcus pullicola TaxID=2838429 RepID=A0A9D2C8R8_9MICO|nr:alcohol dehydrogenase catalytic domain-containing protein [Candidatus Agrococcus pullicola]